MRRRERRRINNKDFLNLLIDYKNRIEKHPDIEIPRDLGQMIDDLIYNIETSASFNRYTYRDEMRSEARKNCFAAISQQKFSLDKENPFGYFTTIVMNSFYKVLSDEKRHSAIKNAMYEEVQLMHPNSRFEDSNEIKADIYKSKEPEHSDWSPITVTTSDGKIKVYETEDSWLKNVEKKRKKKEELALKESEKKK